jgi:hypothetical protein
MPGREERKVCELEFVVPGERETDTLGATLLAALTDELPRRRVMRVDAGREIADVAIHLSQRFAHDMLTKSRLR